MWTTSRSASITRAEIRPAAYDELDKIRDVDGAVFGEIAYPYFVLRQLFDLYRQCWMVADHPDGLLGYSLGALTFGENSAWLLGLGVRREYRRRGYGRQLVTASLHQFAAIGVSDVYLSVHPGNVAALHLYGHLGFTVKGTKRDYLGPGEHRSIMALSL